MENYDIIKDDFNEIAELPDAPKWNHNNCYFNYLLKFVPEKINSCLDIGCGQGELSALLSERADKVIAVDLADKMIDYAKEHNRSANIEYICDNILNMSFRDNSFDLIITTATAHHLPYEWLLEFAKQKLKKGGKLIVLDLVNAETMSDKLLWSFAVIPNFLMNIIKNGRTPDSDPHSKAAWHKHGEHDTYMSLSEIKRLAAKHLSNPFIKRKLFWRYVLIWNKS